ncbi:MAG TPA: PilX N-terminal domain-containing pilus assembly protein [Candidatus Binatia bacterium]|jgi:hypothetical protein
MRTLRSERGVSLVVVIMLMVIILTITAAGMFFSSIDLRVSANYKAGTQAFYAADAGVSDGIARVGLNPITIPQTILATPSGTLTYCGGSLAATNNCTTPQPSKLYGITSDPGYNLAQGTGYNQVGYAFYQYQLNVTGLGPLASAREVEAQVKYGPVPQ